LSRSGSLYARLVLSISIRDITGGFKVWRARALADVIARPVQAGGYAFQIETTYRLIRSGGRVIESPITFAERRAGMSKMSTKIVVEALRVVLNLRTGRTTGDRMPLSAAAIAGAPHDE
jgi:dolichol-phosphate mannosyltransferase